MDDFTARMDLRGALGHYIFLQGHEGELDPGSSRLFGELRAYLYDRLSIEEMESPGTLLGRLEHRETR